MIKAQYSIDSINNSENSNFLLQLVIIIIIIIERNHFIDL